MEASVRKILETASDSIVTEALVSSFKEVERNFTLSSWKTSELDAGHFVEAVRRFIEFKLFGAYTPIGKNLPSLNQPQLSRYESATGNESYRIHIPRMLFVIYGIRNKRGVGHLSSVSPNFMDASYVLSACKWILAELVRIESGSDPQKTVRTIEAVVERNIEGIWNEGEVTRILADGLSLKESILFLLFDDSPRSSEELIKIIEYKNQAYYQKTLRTLHASRMIEYSSDGICTISPKGRLEAEKFIKKMG